MGDLTCTLHESAEFSTIHLRGLQSFDDLDAISKIRFSAFFNRFLKNCQAMYFAHQDGILADQLWGEIGRTMTDLLGYSGLQQWWKTRKHWHTEEFARVVEISSRAEKCRRFRQPMIARKRRCRENTRELQTISRPWDCRLTILGGFVFYGSRSWSGFSRSRDVLPWLGASRRWSE
jgi:hypothetical protein